MDARGKHVRKPVEGERGLVAEDPFSSRPEPPDDELLVLTGREPGQPVQAMPLPLKVSGAHVVRKARPVEPELLGLGSREVPCLRGSELVELLPRWGRALSCLERAHAEMFSN